MDRHFLKLCKCIKITDRLTMLQSMQSNVKSCGGTSVSLAVICVGIASQLAVIQ